jgi:hypothetical protein
LERAGLCSVPVHRVPGRFGEAVLVGAAAAVGTAAEALAGTAAEALAGAAAGALVEVEDLLLAAGS